MAYFPFFVELQDVEGLVVGGGRVAYRKVEKLLPYGPKLTVVAPEVTEEIRTIDKRKVSVIRRAFKEEDLENKQFVIAAAGDSRVNGIVAELCRKQNIPVNSVDDKENCSFLFPALIRRGRLSIGISTGGASPAAAVYVKGAVLGLIPNQLEEILEFPYEMRKLLKERFPEDETGRMKIAKALFAACLERERPLQEREWQAILEDGEGEVYGQE